MSPLNPEQPITDKDPEALPKPRFSLGQVVATPGALEVLQQAERDPAEFLARHVTGDWGDLDDEDKQQNELSVKQGFRILSAYKLDDSTKIWIITEHDRSATTILLPQEY
jgi:hypothetical protein